MLENPITIKNKLGLHARAAVKFVNTANRFMADVRIIKDGSAIDGKSILGILTLAAVQGTDIVIRLDGPDEAAVEALRGPAPTAAEVHDRLVDELQVSQAAVRRRSADYEQRRWAPGRLEPVADALADAVQGWLDLEDALTSTGRVGGPG